MTELIQKECMENAKRDIEKRIEEVYQAMEDGTPIPDIIKRSGTHNVSVLRVLLSNLYVCKQLLDELGGTAFTRSQMTVVMFQELLDNEGRDAILSGEVAVDYNFRYRHKTGTKPPVPWQTLS